MKKWLFVAFVIASFVGLMLFYRQTGEEPCPEVGVGRFIAHAGGAVDGYTYTDSLDALDYNYRRGFRLFELDILKTRDGVYVAAHDWRSWAKKVGYKGELPPTLKVFKSYKIYGKFRPMDIHDINEWFGKHKDAILVTDKINEPVKFSRQFVDKDRLWMEVFSLEAAEEGARAGVRVLVNWGVFKRMGSGGIKKLREMGISDITMSRKKISKHKALLLKLKENGIRIWVYSVNSDRGKDEKYVVKNELRYVYGLYADNWCFKDCQRAEQP